MALFWVFVGFGISRTIFIPEEGIHRNGSVDKAGVLGLPPHWIVCLTPAADWLERGFWIHHPCVLEADWPFLTSRLFMFYLDCFWKWLAIQKCTGGTINYKFSPTNSEALILKRAVSVPAMSIIPFTFKCAVVRFIVHHLIDDIARTTDTLLSVIHNSNGWEQIGRQMDKD